MIVANNFAISDMPKTGGTYISHLLKYHNNHQRFDVSVPVYSFYRDPVDWYISYISFMCHGSVLYGDRFDEPTVQYLQNKYGHIDATKYLDLLLNINKEEIIWSRPNNTAPRDSLNYFFSHLYFDWLESSDKDLYSYCCDFYLKDTIIMPFSKLEKSIEYIFNLHNTPIIEIESEVLKNKCIKKLTLTQQQIDLIKNKTKPATQFYGVE